MQRTDESNEPNEPNELQKKTHYEVLGVLSNVTQIDITYAYYARRGKNESEIEEAYQVLKNRLHRMRYDDILLRKKIETCDPFFKEEVEKLCNMFHENVKARKDDFKDIKKQLSEILEDILPDCEQKYPAYCTFEEQKNHIEYILKTLASKFDCTNIESTKPFISYFLLLCDELKSMVGHDAYNYNVDIIKPSDIVPIIHQSWQKLYAQCKQVQGSDAATLKMVVMLFSKNEAVWKRVTTQLQEDIYSICVSHYKNLNALPKNNELRLMEEFLLSITFRHTKYAIEDILCKVYRKTALPAVSSEVHSESDSESELKRATTFLRFLAQRMPNYLGGVVRYWIAESTHQSFSHIRQSIVSWVSVMGENGHILFQRILHEFNRINGNWVDGYDLVVDKKLPADTDKITVGKIYLSLDYGTYLIFPHDIKQEKKGSLLDEDKKIDLQGKKIDLHSLSYHFRDETLKKSILNKIFKTDDIHNSTIQQNTMCLLVAAWYLQAHVDKKANQDSSLQRMTSLMFNLGYHAGKPNVNGFRALIQCLTYIGWGAISSNPNDESAVRRICNEIIQPHNRALFNQYPSPTKVSLKDTDPTVILQCQQASVTHLYLPKWVLAIAQACYLKYVPKDTQVMEMWKNHALPKCLDIKIEKESLTKEEQKCLKYYQIKQDFLDALKREWSLQHYRLNILSSLPIPISLPCNLQFWDAIKDHVEPGTIYLSEEYDLSEKYPGSRYGGYLYCAVDKDSQKIIRQGYFDNKYQKIDLYSLSSQLQDPQKNTALKRQILQSLAGLEPLESKIPYGKPEAGVFGWSLKEGDCKKYWPESYAHFCKHIKSIPDPDLQELLESKLEWGWGPILRELLLIRPIGYFIDYFIEKTKTFNCLEVLFDPYEGDYSQTGHRSLWIRALHLNYSPELMAYFLEIFSHYRKSKVWEELKPFEKQSIPLFLITKNKAVWDVFLRSYLAQHIGFLNFSDQQHRNILALVSREWARPLLTQLVSIFKLDANTDIRDLLRKKDHAGNTALHSDKLDFYLPYLQRGDLFLRNHLGETPWLLFLKTSGHKSQSQDDELQFFAEIAEINDAIIRKLLQNNFSLSEFIDLFSSNREPQATLLFLILNKSGFNLQFLYTLMGPVTPGNKRPPLEMLSVLLSTYGEEGALLLYALVNNLGMDCGELCSLIQAAAMSCSGAIEDVQKLSQLAIKANENKKEISTLVVQICRTWAEKYMLPADYASLTKNSTAVLPTDNDTWESILRELTKHCTDWQIDLPIKGDTKQEKDGDQKEMNTTQSNPRQKAIFIIKTLFQGVHQAPQDETDRILSWAIRAILSKADDPLATLIYLLELNRTNSGSGVHGNIQVLLDCMINSYTQTLTVLLGVILTSTQETISLSQKLNHVQNHINELSQPQVKILISILLNIGQSDWKKAENVIQFLMYCSSASRGYHGFIFNDTLNSYPDVQNDLVEFICQTPGAIRALLAFFTFDQQASVEFINIFRELVDKVFQRLERSFDPESKITLQDKEYHLASLIYTLAIRYRIKVSYVFVPIGSDSPQGNFREKNTIYFSPQNESYKIYDPNGQVVQEGRFYFNSIISRDLERMFPDLNPQKDNPITTDDIINRLGPEEAYLALCKEMEAQTNALMPCSVFSITNQNFIDSMLRMAIEKKNISVFIWLYRQGRALSSKQLKENGLLESILQLARPQIPALSSPQGCLEFFKVVNQILEKNCKHYCGGDRAAWMSMIKHVLSIPYAPIIENVLSLFSNELTCDSPLTSLSLEEYQNLYKQACNEGQKILHGQQDILCHVFSDVSPQQETKPLTFTSAMISIFSDFWRGQQQPQPPGSPFSQSNLPRPPGNK